MRWGALPLLAACTSFGAARSEDAGTGTGTDAASDPTPSGADAGSRFCDTITKAANDDLVFCSDFEGPLSPSFGWTSLVDTDPIQLRVVDGAGSGASRGLRLTMTFVKAGELRGLRQGLDLEKAERRTSYELSFSFSVKAAKLGCTVLGRLQFVTPGFVSVGAALMANGSQIGTDCAGGRGIDVAPKEWRRVRVVLERQKNATYTQSVNVDGKEIGSITGISLASTNEVDVFAGTYGTWGQSESLDVVFDDVVVRIGGIAP